MKRILVRNIVLLAVLCVAAAAQAQLRIDLRGTASSPTQTLVVTNLANDPPTLIGDGALLTNTFFGINVFEPGEEFTLHYTAVSNWNSSAALASGDINAYLAGLTPADVYGTSDGQTGWGVNTGTNDVFVSTNEPPSITIGSNRINRVGEAMIIEFDLANLSTNHADVFELQQWSHSVASAGELFSYFLIDSALNQILATETNLEATAAPSGIVGLPFDIEDGYRLVIANSDDSESNGFRLDQMVVDIPGAPSPSDPPSAYFETVVEITDLTQSQFRGQSQALLALEVDGAGQFSQHGASTGGFVVNQLGDPLDPALYGETLGIVLDAFKDSDQGFKTEDGIIATGSDGKLGVDKIPNVKRIGANSNDVEAIGFFLNTTDFGSRQFQVGITGMQITQGSNDTVRFVNVDTQASLIGDLGYTGTGDSEKGWIDISALDISERGFNTNLTQVCSIVGEPSPSRGTFWTGLRLTISVAPPELVDIQSETDQVVVSWASGTTATYRVSTASDLTTGNWDLLATNLPGMEAVTHYTNDVLTGTSMYQVEAEWPTLIPPLLNEDFESGTNGWTVSAAGAGTTVWELGTPAVTSTLFTLSSAASGTNCWGTSLNDLYQQGTDITLTSPTIDLTAVTGATLTWRESKDISSTDEGQVLLIDLDAATTNTLHASSGTEEAWTVVSEPLPPAVMGHNVQIQFRLLDDNVADPFYYGWYIDDVVVTPN